MLRGIRRPRHPLSALLATLLSMTVVFSLLPGMGIASQQPRTVSVSDAVLTEGNDGKPKAVFTVTVSSQGGPVTVQYYTSDGSAVAGSDYTAQVDSVTIQGGSTSAEVEVRIIPDLIDEDDEIFKLTLSTSTGAEIQDGSAVATIVDDDPFPGLSVVDTSVLEGNSADSSLEFTVLLSAVSGRPVQVAYATREGTASSADFETVSGTITFSPGQRSSTVPVKVHADLVNEYDEDLTLELSNPLNAVLTDGEAVGTILDDDPAPTLAINDVFAMEGHSDGGVLRFTISLSAPSGKAISGSFATSDGSALAGEDYAASSGTFSIAPGDSSAQVSVPLIGDAKDEYDENFYIRISEVTNANVADGEGLGTILNDDTAPQISINDVSVEEGAGEGVFATFEVTLSAPSGKEVRVDFATEEASAKAATDFFDLQGVLTFSPGQTSHSLPIPLRGDSTDEDDETFLVRLSEAVNATIADAEGAAIIRDDDPPPSISVADVSVAEGNAGAVSVNLKVALSTASGKQISVDYTTSEGSASAGGDYVGRAGSLTFAPGEISQDARVEITGDLIDEEDESFTIALSSPQNAVLGRAQAQVLITDDDAAPIVSIQDTSVYEPTAGTMGANFDVTLSDISAKEILVEFAPTDGSAIAGLDYMPAGGTVRFSPGTRTARVTVDVVGDVIGEPDESFEVVLKNPVNVQLGDDRAVATIIDSSRGPKLSISDASVAEEPEPISISATEDFEDATLNFPVTGNWSRSTTSAQTGAYGYRAAAIGHNGTTSATFIINYPATSTNRKLTLWYRVSSECGFDYLRVQLNGGQIAQASCNSGWVKLERTAGLNAGDNTLQVTYSKDYCCVGGSDTAWIDNITVSYAIPPGPAEASFDVRLSQPMTSSIQAKYQTLPGSASAGADYSPVEGTITFAAGETLKQVRVSPVADTLDEFDETFTVRLSESNVEFDDAEGVGTILDNDAPPAISVDDVSVNEKDAPGPATFNVTLSSPSAKPISIAYATADGSAKSGDDYKATSGTLSFPSGTTARSVSVEIVADTQGEDSETFDLRLSSPQNLTVADDRGVATIVNDDPILKIHEAYWWPERYFDFLMTEGDGPQSGRHYFYISLDPPQTVPVTVEYRTDGGNATAGADYMPARGTLTFGPGETFEYVWVQTNGDFLVEPTENYSVELFNATNASILEPKGWATVQDDDPIRFYCSWFCDAFATEGDPLWFNVSFDRISDMPITLDFATKETEITCFSLCARPAADYTPTRADPIILPGSYGASLVVPTFDDPQCESHIPGVNWEIMAATAKIVSPSIGGELRMNGYIYDNDYGPGCL